MGASKHEIVATWFGYTHTFGDDDSRVEIGDIRLANGESEIAKIRCREDELVVRGTYRLFGRYQKHPQYGEQFIASSWVEEKPVDEDSIIAYLAQCKGPAKGSITHRVAVKLFEKYGFQAIDMVITSPAEAANDIPRWDADKAAIASKVLSKQDTKRGAKLDLILLFSGRSFPKQTTERAIMEFGTGAAEIIRGNPYALMQLPGIGFKGADKLYCELAKERCGTDGNAYKDALAAIHRQGLCACYEVSQDRTGSTWVLRAIAKAGVKKNVRDTRAKPDEAIEWAVSKGRLVTYSNNGQEWVANARRALHEREIGWFVGGDEASMVTDWPDVESTVTSFCPDGKPLSEHQCFELQTSLTSRVGCLQGSPGVGKTFAVACLVKAIISEFGTDSIAVACPTGKAAVRASQALNENGVEFEVKTIHRLLGVKSQSGGGWQFTHNEDVPLPYRFIVIDESSMTDVDLCASLIRACTFDTHILFVGDINQLAPVGHGRPFEDLQQLVPTGRLTEIRRNSGRIVQACADIRDYKKFTPSKNLDIESGENMLLIELSNADGQLNAIENLVRKLGTEDEDCDVTWDIQVVTALNEKSEVSRKPLNHLLQSVLNPDGLRVKGNPFRVGDKIVCLKNGSYQDTEENEVKHFVANGELAEVMYIRPGRMIVRLFDPPRQIVVPYAVNYDKASGEDDGGGSKGAVGDWDLGYALSTHRSQGSQWKYVIVIADSSSSASGVQSRNWLYTAISRAVVATFILGRRQDCQKMMTRDGTGGRKTFLVEKTLHGRAVRTVDFKALFAKV
jgi:exodeoxyribonuclease V alpha subunit